MASEALRPNGVDFADAQFAPDGRVRTELVRVTQSVRSDPAKANDRIRPNTHRLQPILQLGSICEINSAYEAVKKVLPRL